MRLLCFGGLLAAYDHINPSVDNNSSIAVQLSKNNNNIRACNAMWPSVQFGCCGMVGCACRVVEGFKKKDLDTFARNNVVMN